jgi:predicted DNA-binding protein with PD1-like motif
MESAVLEIGRTFGVRFDHGDDFFDALRTFCREHDVKQGYIPMFLAGFSVVELVGTCQALDDPGAPVWSSVYLTNVEVLGGGTLAYDAGEGTVKPHLHVTAGLKQMSALGHTSHLLSGTVQFLVEMVVVEIIAPALRRIPDEGLYGVPLLSFGP